MSKRIFSGAIALLASVLVLLLASPAGNPLNLFKGARLDPEIVLLRAADSIVSYLPLSLRSNIDVASLERSLEGEDLKRPDNPGAWARYRAMQLASDAKGTITPDGLMKASEARLALLARSSSSAVAPAGAGLGPGQWTWIGPGNQGGRIRTVLIHPTVPSTLWIGSVGGGIWKSVNSGASWSPVQDFMANLAVTSLAMEAGNPSIMYAATGEGFFNGDAIRGSGVFKSTNGGTTWSRLAATDPVGNGDWYWVNRLAVHPTLAGQMLAATRGGIYRTTNGGTTWSKAYAAANASGVTDVKYAPDDGNRAIMGLGYAGGTVMYSANAGASWSASNLTTSGRVEVVFGTGGVAFAMVDASNGKLYKSTNSGASWSLVSVPGHLSGQGWYANALWVDPSNNNHIIIGGLDLYRSTNGGTSFTKISNWMYGGQYGDSAHADHHAIVAVPGYDGSTRKAIYFGNDGGLYRADDVTLVGQYGAGWTNLNNGLGITQFYGGAGHDGVNGRIVGGTQDNGDHYYGGTGTNWYMLAGGDGGESAIDPTDGNYVYGEYVYLQIHRATNGVGPADDIVTGLTDAGTENALFIAPFEIDKWNPNTMWGGSTSLWRTSNVKAATPTWSSVFTGASPISEIALGSSSNLWFGTSSGLVYNTINATAATPSFSLKNSGLPSGRALLSLAVDKVSLNTVYAGFGGYNTGNLWRTTNGGASWTNIHGALPASPIYAIETQPGHPNRVYVGTEVGLFTSEDGGATWNTSNDGPANVAVFDLFWLNNQTLVAVTHGRGMFKATVNEATTFVLTYTRAGSGSGTVAFSPAGTQSSCAASCSNTYASGVVVTLSASASAGSTFAGWSGAGCSGTGTCQVTMSAARAVTATFNAAPTVILTYTKAGKGSGTVTFSPAGTQSSCVATCSSSFTAGTVVTLSATPSAGSTFAGWSGSGCRGTGVCQLTMAAAKTVKATFNPAKQYAVRYTKAGSGAGTVTFSPAGTLSSCAATCSNSYTSGTVVTLSATPAIGSTFAGWSGSGCSGTGTCQLTMTAAKTVKATFNVAPSYALSYTRAGAGAGTVTFSPAGTQSSCAASCTNNYASGTVVTLSAAAAGGSSFTGWGGACSGTGTCQVTMSAARAVTATFDTLPSYALTYTKIGAGAGTVSFSPAGTQSSCAASCTNSYASGTVVTLSAAATGGSSFTGWGGVCSGTGTCQVTMSAARAVTASFVQTYSLAVSKAGSGTGTVSSSPAGISCGGTCSAAYQSGTQVTLTAAASSSAVLATALPPSSSEGRSSALARRRAAGGRGTILADVAFNPAALNQDRLTLAIDGRELEFARQRVDARAANDLSWFGRLASGEGTIVVTVKDGQAIAVIEVNAVQYEITTEDLTSGALVRINSQAFPPEHPAAFPGGALKLAPPAGAPSQGSAAATADNVTVDVLVAYTTAAKVGYGGSMQTLAQASVDAANQAYLNSGINIAMRLAGTKEVTYTETTFDAAVNDLVNGANGMAVVQSERNAVGADLVGLMVNMSDYCGLAAAISATSNYGYMAVNHGCAVSNESFAHEFGHLFGARHDPYVDPTATPYAYGHGYIAPNNAWRTVMAYVNGCGSCQRLRYFSSPLISYGGIPMGTVATNDNARVHRERASTVAAFRQPQAQTYTVSLSVYPALAGNVSGGGTFAANSTVTVSAVASAGYAFSNWTEGGNLVSSSASYSFTLTGNRSLQANFVSIAGFVGWSGDCSGSNPTCLVTMNAAKSVTASFSAASTYTISYTKAGTGAGTVSFSPAGSLSSCSASCSNIYSSGTVVTLSASAGAGATFAGWSGGICSGTGSCQVTMSAARSVTATFNTAVTYALSYTKAGSGAGTVSFSPAGTQSSCSASCSNSYTSGTVVTLTASAAGGSAFAGWSGVCSGTGSCQVTMSAARSVTATFNLSCSGIGCDMESNLNWTSYYSGASPFYSQSTYVSGYSGSSAARSGAAGDSSYTCIYTTIQAPGSLTLIWSPSSETGYDWLNFYFNNSLADGYSGSGAEASTWFQDNYSISGTGYADIDFCYEKDSSTAARLDAGFLDKVSYVRTGAAAPAKAGGGPITITRLSTQRVDRQGRPVGAVSANAVVRHGAGNGAGQPSPRVRFAQ